MKPNTVQPILRVKVIGRSPVTVLGIRILGGQTLDLCDEIHKTLVNDVDEQTSDNFYNSILGASARIRKALEKPDGELYVKWKVDRTIDIIEWVDPAGLLASNEPFDGAILSFQDGQFLWIENDAASENLPTADEKAAMAGSAGKPSAGNKFITEDDPRITGMIGGGGGGQGGGSPSGVAGGDLGGFYPDPNVVGFHELGGDALVFGSVSDGEVLVRSGNSIVGTTIAGGTGNIGISAGTEQVVAGTVRFVNSNGVSWGLNNSSLTASYTVPTQSTQIQSFNLEGNTAGVSNVTGDIVFLSAGNNVTLSGTSNSIIFSAAGGGAGAGQQFTLTGNTVGNSTVSGSTIFLSGGNNVTLSGTSNSIAISVANQTVQPQSISLTGNTAGNSTITGNVIFFSGGNNVTLSGTNNTIVVSAAAAAGAGQNFFLTGNTSGNTTVSGGTIILSAVNNLTISGSNDTIVLSGPTLTQFLTTQSVQAQSLTLGGNTAGQSTVTGNAITLAGGNNITLSGAAGAVTISAAAQSQQTQNIIRAVEAGTETLTSGTLSFADSNGVSWGLDAGVLTATVKTDYLTTQFNQAFSAQGGSSSFQTLNFANSNGVSFSNSNGSVVASHNGLTSQSNQAVSAANGSFAFQTLSLADSNGVSFSTGTQGIFATVKTDYLTTQTVAPQSITLGGNTAGQSTVTGSAITWAGGNNITLSGAAGAVTISAAAQSQQTQNIIRAVIAGTGTQTSGTVSFANSNGISFGLDAGTLTASHNGLTSQSNQAVSAGNGSFTFQTLSLADSNGVSFSTGTQGIFATVRTDYLTTQSGQAFSAAGGSTTFQTLNFANSNGLTFSNSNGSVVASYTVPSTAGLISAINVSAGTTSNNLTALTLSNSNGVSFGLNGSVITGSHNGLTSQSNQAASAANGSFAFQTINFSNANGVSFGTSAGSAITASHNGLTSQSNQAVSAGNGSFTFQTISLADSNGVSFSTGTQGLFATVKTDYLTTQTVQAQSMTLTGNTAGNSTVTGNVIFFSGGPNITLSGTNNTIVVSGASAPAAAQSFVLTGNTLGDNSVVGSTIVLSAINNITLSGTSDTIIISGPTQSQQTQNIIRGIADSAGTQTSGTVQFSNSNGVSFGLNAGTLTASHNGLTSQSNQAVSAANGSFAFQTLSFSNLNGVSFGTSAGSAITASHNGLTSQSNQAVSAGNGSFAFQTLSFSNANGISFGTSAGSALTASYTVPTQTVAPQSITLGGNTSGQSTVTGTAITWAGGNNITLSGAAGAITISAASQSQQTQNIIRGIADSAGTQTSGTVQFSNSNGVSFGLNAGTLTASHNGLTSQSNQAVSGANGSFAFQTLSFSNANGVSFGTSAGSAVTASINALTNINISAGTTSNNLTAVTFSNSNGISFGLNGSVVTGSHNGLTSQSNQAASGSNGSFTFQTLLFSNGNGISFGTSAGSAITASHNALTSQSNQAYSGANGSATFQTLSFANSNGVSFSTGTQGLFASHNGLSHAAFSLSGNTFSSDYGGGISHQSTGAIDSRNITIWGQGAISINNVTFGGPGTTYTSGTGASFTIDYQNNLLIEANALTFAGFSNQTAGAQYTQSSGQINLLVNTAVSKNVALFLSDGDMYGNYTQSNEAKNFFIEGNTLGTASYTATHINLAGGDNITLSALSNASQITIIAPAPVNMAAGTQTATSGTVVFSNSNGVSFGMSGSSRITATFGLTATAGTQSNLVGGVHLADSNGVSFGLNGSVFTATVRTDYLTSQSQQTQNIIRALAAGGATQTSGTVQFSNSNGVSFGLNAGSITASVSGLAGSIQNWEPRQMSSSFTLVSNVVYLHQAVLPAYMTAPNAAYMGFVMSNSASAGGTMSQYIALYTKNAGTLSLLSSASRTWGFASNAAASSYSLVSGPRIWSIPLTWGTMTPGEYSIGLMMRCATSGTSGSWSALGFSTVVLTGREFTNGTAAVNGMVPMPVGTYATTTTAFPSAITLGTQINRALGANFCPWFMIGRSD